MCLISVPCETPIEERRVACCISRTELRRSDYHRVAEGYGGVGLLLTDPAKVDGTLHEAKKIAAGGKPVCINVHLRATDFRKGSISM